MQRGRLSASRYCRIRSVGMVRLKLDELQLGNRCLINRNAGPVLSPMAPSQIEAGLTTVLAPSALQDTPSCLINRQRQLARNQSGHCSLWPSDDMHYGTACCKMLLTQAGCIRGKGSTASQVALAVSPSHSKGSPPPSTITV